MPIFTSNLEWMITNVLLASIPMVLVLLLRKKQHPVIHYCLLVLWFIFLPNTIYLVTDLQYLPRQLLITVPFEQVFLLAEYIILTFLGIVTYLYALEPIELIVEKFHAGKENENIFYILLHFVAAFGVVLGKTQRTHSWFVFTDFSRVVRDVKNVISSPTLLMWIVIVGVIINILFFLFKNDFKIFKKKGKRRKR